MVEEILVVETREVNLCPRVVVAQLVGDAAMPQAEVEGARQDDQKTFNSTPSTRYQN